MGVVEDGFCVQIYEKCMEIKTKNAVFNIIRIIEVLNEVNVKKNNIS